MLKKKTTIHYILYDGDGRYLHHFMKPKQDSKGSSEDDTNSINSDQDEEDNKEESSNLQKELEKKPAEVVARLLVEWMTIYGIDETLKLLAADSTNPNTGWRAGVIAWVERILDRKFHWLICQLHTNELMLCHLIQKLDGKTDSKTGCSGPLGKMLNNVKDMKPNYDFERIDLGPNLIELPEEVLHDLSTDQNLLYKRCKAVKSGVLPKDVALRKSGPIVHSRWLTTAETFLEMWQKNHGLEGELLERLRTIVTFIVSEYCPMWFKIKAKYSWLEGPCHILYELSLFRLQPEHVQEILLPTLQRSAWNSHSESVLQTMICSSDREDWKFPINNFF